VIDIARNYDVMFDGAVALYKVQEWYCGDHIITLSNKVKKGAAHNDLARNLMN